MILYNFLMSLNLIINIFKLKNQVSMTVIIWCIRISFYNRKALLSSSSTFIVNKLFNKLKVTYQLYCAQYFHRLSFFLALTMLQLYITSCNRNAVLSSIYYRQHCINIMMKKILSQRLPRFHHCSASAYVLCHTCNKVFVFLL